MFHARIDTIDHRQIIGCETGTRAEFDSRHNGDPLWIFLDSYKVKYRVNFSNFIKHPYKYRIDTYNELHLSNDPPIIIVEEDPTAPVGYSTLMGRDGRYLKGTDGKFLYGYEINYTPPPEGNVYLTDGDNALLQDPDSVFITEPV